jgi:ubiquinone/menaquinone biosynthesis C-methylase UbiE
MQIAFVHPVTKQPLAQDAQGTLSCVTSTGVYMCRREEGCCDFVGDRSDVGKTRDVYDRCYSEVRREKVTVRESAACWSDRTLAWRKTLLESLGDLTGKRVLLLGNGTSCREFHFLSLGCEVVFTDLSMVAVQRARQVFLTSEFAATYGSRIQFHAVDATRLPFADDSFDVVYGTKVVPFLPDLGRFYTEVARCLRPGGMCRFIDDAYSPAWDAIRRTVVVPVKARLLWRFMSELGRVRSHSNPRSEFGLRKEVLEPFVERCGFKRLVFKRQFFLLRIAQMLWGKAVGCNPKWLRLARPVYVVMLRIDDMCAGTRWMERNALSLVHGFDK